MTSSRSFKIETPPNAGFVWHHENFYTAGGVGTAFAQESAAIGACRRFGAA
jgi:hypothetical protein